jgi:hypothetical protein
VVTSTSTDIIFSSTFDRMNIDINLLQPAEIPLIGFRGKRVNALGKISLPVSFRDLTNPRTENITFNVVEMNYPYLAIFGRGFLNKFEVVVHQLYLCMKILAAKGVITVHGNQELARDIEQGVATVKAEVQRLLDANVIRVVKYPTWLANTVLVKKKNGKWCMCIDFTGLNKACLKEDFPLPRIDRVVDDAANSQLMSLLFFEYHQIWMKKEDEEKTSFTTPFGTYCFIGMPEGLKNVGQSFSRMSLEVLGQQLRRNVLAYVDDIVVTSTRR